MAKKIRFPLEMADGAQVRNLEELREHFDLEAVISYYKSGKLLTWLRDRYFEEEAESVEALSENAADFQQQLCGIFQVKFTGEQVDLGEVAKRQERLAKLRQFTDEEEFIDHIDQVAFDQEELADLLDENTETIYLCGTYFVVPARCDHVTYIGINQPTVHISGLEKGKRLSSDIHFHQIKVDTPPVDIDVASLNSELAECYIISLNDPIPEGVTETDSVEAWLKHCYKELGLNENDEISIAVDLKLAGVTIYGEVNPDSHLTKPFLCGDEQKSVPIKGLEGMKLLDETEHISDKPFGCQFEVFLPYSDIDRASDYLNREVPFKNPRSAASALVRRLCTEQDANMVQLLCFYPINSMGLDGTYLENLKTIQALGNCPDDIIKTKSVTGNLKELLEHIRRRFVKIGKRRPDLSYPIDGMVVSVADVDQQKQIGRKGRTNKWQIALKFNPDNAVGVVDGIELTPGKKGFRTIQVCLEEPVFIDGVKYDHIPVLSAELFDKLELCKGDNVRVHRTGDVIPSITVEKRNDGKKLSYPDDCPFCGKEMIWEAKKLKCVNPDCEANLAGRFLTFFDVAKIKGIGDATANAFVKAGFRSVIDMIETDSEDDKFVKAGFSKHRAKDLQKDILNAFEWMRDYEVMAAMGIPGIGIETAKKIIKKMSSMKNSNSELFDIINEMRLQLHINASGEGSGNNGASGNEYHAWKTYKETFAKYVKNHTEKWDDNMKLVGHTGISIGDKARAIIRGKGWDVTDGRKFDYLIVASHDHDSTKTRIAKERNIPMHTEDEFIEKFSTHDTENSTSHNGPKIEEPSEVSGSLIGMAGTAAEKYLRFLTSRHS